MSNSKKEWDFDNYDDNNIEFISKPFVKAENNNSNSKKAFTLVQENSPCKVTTSLEGMKKSIEFLLK